MQRGGLGLPGVRLGDVPLAPRHLGEVELAADQVDGVVELLGALAGALDVAGALGPAVLVGVQGGRGVDEVLAGEVVHLVAEPVVAGPPPDQRDGRRELHRLVGVAGVGVGAEVDGAVGDHLVDDLAGVAVDDPADVAQRAQVVLGGRELPDGDGGEVGVLAVGREQPGVVGEAGAEEVDLGHRTRGRRVVDAGVGLPHLQRPALRAAGDLGEVGEVLLAPGDGLLAAAGPRAGRRRCWPRASGRQATFLANSAAGCAAALLNSLRAAARPRSEPATVNHTVTPFAGTLSVYRSWPPAPLPYAVSSQTGGVGGVLGPLAGQITRRVLGPAERGARAAARGLQRRSRGRTDDRRPVVRRLVRAGRRPRSRKTRRPPETVAVSGRLTAVWLGFVSPQG